MNVGFMTMNNLQLPTEDAPQENAKTSNGLLSRNVETKKSVSMSKEPRDRVAYYVSEIRKGRMDLKNG